jgi:hypothetical protein
MMSLLWIGLDTTCILSVSLLMLILVCCFTNLILEFLIRLVVLFVVFLGLKMFFKMISHLLNFL